MNRMIGCGDALTSAMTDLSRFSNSPLTPAPACSRPRSSVRTATFLQRRRHVAGHDAQGEALDHGRLADAGLAGQDRVVLPAPRQDVDDLADLEIAADDRVDLALLGPVGQVERELVEGRRLRPGRGGRGAGRLGRSRRPRTALSADAAIDRRPGRAPAASAGCWPVPARPSAAAPAASGRSAGPREGSRSGPAVCLVIRATPAPTPRASTAPVPAPDPAPAGRCRASASPARPSVRAGRAHGLTSKCLRRRVQVAVGRLQQLEQPVLDLDLVVGLGDAQAEGVDQGACGRAG